MTRFQPFYMQKGSYGAVLDRQVVALLGAAEGVQGKGDMKVSQRGAGANMSVDVAAGRCIVAGTTVTAQGSYLCWSDAVENVAIGTAPGTGQTRIDLIVAHVRDSYVDADIYDDFVISAVAGTPAATGSQQPPAAPASSFELAQVTVGPNVTQIVDANISDSRLLPAFGLPWRLPWGRRKMALVTGAQTGIGTGANDLTNLALSALTVSGDRHLKITGTVSFQVDSGSPTTVGLELMEKVDAGAWTQVANANLPLSGTIISTLVVVIDRTPNGSIQYKLQGGCNTGTIKTVSSSTQPAMLIVEDMGPNFT